MYQKFVQAVPLYRQEKDWKQMGFPISRATLSNWILKTSEEWLSLLVGRLEKELLKDKHIHADETPVMWVYTTSANSRKNIRIFRYSPNRAGDNAKDFLKAFDGYLHTDGYSGYKKVKGIKQCLCWAHLRRYFSDALPKDMKSQEANLPSQGIAYCNKLFEWERVFKVLSSEERKIKRLEKEKPILVGFW